MSRIMTLPRSRSAPSCSTRPPSPARTPPTRSCATAYARSSSSERRSERAPGGACWGGARCLRSRGAVVRRAGSPGGACVPVSRHEVHGRGSRRCCATARSPWSTPAPASSGETAFRPRSRPAPTGSIGSRRCRCSRHDLELVAIADHRAEPTRPRCADTAGYRVHGHALASAERPASSRSTAVTDHLSHRLVRRRTEATWVMSTSSRGCSVDFAVPRNEPCTGLSRRRQLRERRRGAWCSGSYANYPANSHRLIKIGRLAADNWPDNWQLSGQSHGLTVIMAQVDWPDNFQEARSDFERRQNALNASAIPDLIEVEHLAIPRHRVRYAGVSGPASKARSNSASRSPLPLPHRG